MNKASGGDGIPVELFQILKDDAFEYTIQVGHNFSSKEQVSFNFMAAITICSDFGAPPNKVFHCFHCFPIYCQEVMGPDAYLRFLNVEL